MKIDLNTRVGANVGRQTENTIYGLDGQQDVYIALFKQVNKIRTWTNTVDQEQMAQTGI